MSAVIRQVKALWSRCVFGEAWSTEGRWHVRTDFLFAQPSGLHGAARIVDIGGMYDIYNMSATPDRADANALFADMVVIGQDLARVVELHQASSDQDTTQMPLPFVTNATRARELEAK